MAKGTEKRILMVELKCSKDMTRGNTVKRELRDGKRSKNKKAVQRQK